MHIVPGRGKGECRSRLLVSNVTLMNTFEQVPYLANVPKARIAPQPHDACLGRRRSLRAWALIKLISACSLLFETPLRT